MLKHELTDLYESIKLKEAEKVIKKQDVKNTERKMEKDVVDLIGGNEISFINNFIKKGEQIDHKQVKSLDSLLKKYKAKIGQSKIKSDGNILLLAPIIASMYHTLKD